MWLNISNASSFSNESCCTNVTNDTILNSPQNSEKQLLIIALPIIVLVGLIGNTLSFIILLSKPMRKTSVYFFLAVLAVSDTMVLLLSAFKTWIVLISGIELLRLSNVSCKIIFYLTNISYHTSAWIIVLVTFDRFVAVWLPLKSASICTVRRAKIATVVLTVVMAAYNSYIPILYSLHPVETEAGTTVYRCQSPNSYVTLALNLTIIRSITYCFVPFIVIFIFNICIDFKLRKIPKITLHQTFSSAASSKHNKQTKNINNLAAATTDTADKTSITTCFDDDTSEKNMTNFISRSPAVAMKYKNKKKKSKNDQSNNMSSKTQRSHQTKLTRMLFAISISWLVLTAPYSLHSLFTLLFPKQDAVAKQSMILIKAVCFMLYYINHSINFFLYCLVGKKFRTRMKSFFYKCCSRRLSHSTSVRTMKSHFFEMDQMHQNSSKFTSNKINLAARYLIDNNDINNGANNDINTENNNGNNNDINNGNNTNNDIIKETSNNINDNDISNEKNNDKSNQSMHQANEMDDILLEI